MKKILYRIRYLVILLLLLLPMMIFAQTPKLRMGLDGRLFFLPENETQWRTARQVVIEDLAGERVMFEWSDDNHQETFENLSTDFSNRYPPYSGDPELYAVAYAGHFTDKPSAEQSWQDTRGIYYQMDANQNLWFAIDGDNWKRIREKRWKGPDFWYRMDDFNRVWRSPEGNAWELSPNNVWESASGDQYQLLPDGSVQHFASDDTSTHPIKGDWSRVSGNLWIDNRGNKYQISGNNTLWVSVNNGTWKASETGIWRGSDGKYYQIDYFNNLKVSDDGQGWKTSSDNIWVNQGREYTLGHTGELYARSF